MSQSQIRTTSPTSKRRRGSTEDGDTSFGAALEDQDLSPDDVFDADVDVSSGDNAAAETNVETDPKYSWDQD